MSVILFNEDEVDRLTSGLLDCETVLSGLDFSPEYAIWEKRELQFEPKKPILDIKKEFIRRIMWYVYVANKTAYSLQYQENPDYFNGRNGEPQPLSIKITELWTAIHSLNYNLYTNDGNKFIEEKWYKPFELIIKRLDDSGQTQKESPVQIVVEVEKGIVSGVHTNKENTSVEVLDTDIREDPEADDPDNMIRHERIKKLITRLIPSEVNWQV